MKREITARLADLLDDLNNGKEMLSPDTEVKILDLINEIEMAVEYDY